jgi:hypothetical protein
MRSPYSLSPILSASCYARSRQDSNNPRNLWIPDPRRARRASRVHLRPTCSRSCSRAAANPSSSPVFRCEAMAVPPVLDRRARERAKALCEYCRLARAAYPLTLQIGLCIRHTGVDRRTPPPSSPFSCPPRPGEHPINFSQKATEPTKGRPKTIVTSYVPFVAFCDRVFQTDCWRIWVPPLSIRLGEFVAVHELFCPPTSCPAPSGSAHHRSRRV